MKKIIALLACKMLLFSATFHELLQGVQRSELLLSKKYEILAKKRLWEAQKGKSLFSVDMSLQGAYLRSTPTMQIHLGIPGMPSEFQAASQNQYRGEISISYPLFTGFALTNLIKKSEAEWIEAKLKKEDLLRNLYLKVSTLYAQLFALQKKKMALIEGVNASDTALKKAKGFFQEGLIAKSDLDNIEAKKFEMLAKVSQTEANIEQVREVLAYLTKESVQSAENLPVIALPKRYDISKRSDIQALKEALKMDEYDLQIAKSGFYPKIFLKAALRGYGNDLHLKGDGYRNGDESYAAFELRYNFYHGGSDKATLEAAKYKKMARSSFLHDYIRFAKSQLKSDEATLKALFAKEQWAKKRLDAARSYYKLTLGRFENQLASADELSRAIANLAEAKAIAQGVKAAIFSQQCKIVLEISLEEFKRRVGL